MLSLEAKKDREIQRLRQLSPDYPDPDTNKRGVLLSDQIEYLSENHHLIGPFDSNHLKPAAYKLTIGDEYYLGGQFRTLSEDASEAIEIPPFEVAVIKTTETLCLPRFLIARWNIRVQYAYKGLIWVGGPQVDPGYVGHLFCPIYNLSNKTVTLRRGWEIAVIDFVKTSPFDASKCEKYPENPHPIIENLVTDEFKSGLFEQVGARLDTIEVSTKQLENRFATFFTLVLATVAITISMFVLVSSTTGGVHLDDTVWGSAIFSIALFSLFLSILNLFSFRYHQLLTERTISLLGWKIPHLRAMLARYFYFGWAAALVIGLIAFGIVFATVQPDRLTKVEEKFTKLNQSVTESTASLEQRVRALEEASKKSAP